MSTVPTPDAPPDAAMHPDLAPVRPAAPLDLAAVRAELTRRGGKHFWRSFEEVADSPDFQQFLQKEFPRQAAPLDGTVDRRDFLKLMSASLALAGLSACTRQPTEHIVPYVKAPEEIVPGLPLYFATAMPFAGGATGLLVESHMGRPTKVEGNPQHPASLGATDVFAQASILGLYDPERAQVIASAGEIRPWGAFVEAMRAALEAQKATGGAGLRILTGVVTSPTLAAQIRELLTTYPRAKWHQWEPLARDNALAGARLAFGTAVEARYHVERADVIVSLDGDLLGSGPGSLRYVRELAARRRPRPDDPAAVMPRLYVAESTPTITGTRADHRLPVRASEVEGLAWALAAAVGASGALAATPGAHQAWVEAVARDLAAHRGRSLVVAGDHQPPAVHALALAINDALGNVGVTVTYAEPVAAAPTDTRASLQDLVADMDGEKVDVLLILGGNPVYDAPADLGFAARLAKVELRVHLGLYDDETSLLCHWHIPEAHYLESWSDTRAFDGTVTVLQPLIAPLYEGRTAHEVLATCTDRPDRTSYEIVRAYWQQASGAADFERFWRTVVHDGVVPGTARTGQAIAVRPDWATRAAEAHVPVGEGELEILFQADAAVYDGRFANNGWLQELPRPLTKLTWDNVAIVSGTTAARLGVQNEDVVELAFKGRKLRAPIWIVPGQPNDAVTVQLGYGRTRVGKVGDGVGFDAYQLRTSDALGFGRGLTLRKTGERYALACTQDHHSMHGRHLVRTASLDEYRANPHFAQELEHAPAADMTLYPPFPYEGHAWGMAIDLSTCIGCNACVVACQAENNIPVVGKDQVARGREMQWIRIDRYWEGDDVNPRIHHQPVPCMHCEMASCEVVCPVNATVHDSEGINNMVYNRCVGTKYCSNNCPYKVRRFNFYLYNDWTTESLKLMRNPDVTVRSRGVMEKCTYCVQRINHVRIEAKREERPIRDGEILTACQQVCPAQAITFGDLNDPESQVVKQKQEARNYALLAELNTRPRTTYLAELLNPNPALAAPAPKTEGHA